MADTKISALTAATAALAADELAINEAGTSKKLTVALLRDFLFVNIGRYDPGSFTVPTEQYVQMVQRLTLTGSERATLQGTARLRIN